MKLVGFALILTFILNSCEKGEDVHCNNQYIIAGVSDKCFEIIDIIPDSVISPISIYKSTNKSLKASHRSYAEMLLQSDDGFGKDGDYDFKFESEYSTALGGAYYIGVFLSNFNNSYLECSMSQDSNYCQFYEIGDTIHNDDLWLKKDRIRLSFDSGVTCPPICPERRDTINAYLNDKYIGLRIASQLDTNYYWYRFDIEYFHYLTLKEFGRQR